jgi:ribosome modulation factor
VMTGTVATPTGRPSDVQIRRAHALGYYAGRDGEPPTACPYSVNGSPVQRGLVQVWLRAYNKANPASVSYEG